MDYANCAGCRRSQGLDAVVGGIAKLAGDWVVNQYWGKEGFLGWLALQPRFHRMKLSELTDREARSLGPNVQALDEVLTRYWSHQFPADDVERVYIVYMFESEFQEPRPRVENEFHLHVHLIPRTKALAQDGRLRFEKDGVTWNDGWHMPRMSQHGVIPEAYQLTPDNRVDRATSLMNYIRHELAGRP
jgi:diadenosine tetraphosphate (Ap4A) HIT family hydrolase